LADEEGIDDQPMRERPGTWRFTVDGEPGTQGLETLLSEVVPAGIDTCASSCPSRHARSADETPEHVAAPVSPRHTTVIGPSEVPSEMRWTSTRLFVSLVYAT
jgi:hypothetical protein